VPTVPGSTGDPTAGKALFVANCAMCHGDDGQGRSGASLDQGFASINPQQFVRATVAEGIENSAMPAWSQTNGGPLTESEIDNISAFIITLPGQSQQQPAATATPAPAPASDGGGTNWLMIILALVLVVVVIVAIIALSGRNKTA
jgi:mono/diheme cytochrome c family protein